MEIKHHEITLKIDHKDAESIRVLAECFASTLGIMLEVQTKEQKDYLTYHLLKRMQDWGFDELKKIGA